jgi:predicted dehydrogenase
LPGFRLGIIGCGAVTELAHLPACRAIPQIEISVLVDVNLDRARRLAKMFNVSRCEADYRKVFGAVDGVSIALPHYLHADVAIEFLERGISALVEKPLACTRAEANAMMNAARTGQSVLQPAYMYRFCNGARTLRDAIQQSWLGNIESFTAEMGCVYSWPVASGFFFSPREAGGGVLVDSGSHLLDLLLWCLGDAVEVSYCDDNLGGMEAECSLSLVLRTGSHSVSGTVALSRIRKLGRFVRVAGTKTTMEYDLDSPQRVQISPTHAEGALRNLVAEPAYDSASWADPWERVYAAQLRSFAKAAASRTQPEVAGSDVLGTVALIERCYRERQPLIHSWEAVTKSACP